MSKGERTRKEIIDKAFLLAGDLGLEALSLGTLAAETGLSKSGLFAHFKSKEALQLDVIEEVRLRFVETVIRPALATPRGEPRVRAFSEGYLNWIKTGHPNGGCIYMALCHEYDDRPGPVRDKLVANQLDLYDTLARIVQTAVDTGDFRADLDPQKFVFDFIGIKMAYQHRAKFLGIPDTYEHARMAFEALIERSRATPKTTTHQARSE
jgi:AcrR family transcriptional regulator